MPGRSEAPNASRREKPLSLQDFIRSGRQGS
jgi:hypothetical protein